MLIEKDYVLQIAVMLKRKKMIMQCGKKRIYLTMAVKRCDVYSDEENKSFCKMVLRSKSCAFYAEVTNFTDKTIKCF